MKFKIRYIAFFVFLFALCVRGEATEKKSPAVGFVLHFEHLNVPAEGPVLVRKAKEAGAEVINVVPPARVWDSTTDVETLDAIIGEIEKQNLRFLLTRIDASHLPDSKGWRYSYLYKSVIDKLGVLPSGKNTSEYFRTTVNADGYRQWLLDETRYYARKFGRHPRLLAFDIGPFSEPFVSQRGSLLAFDDDSNAYESAQYTPEAARWWKMWLRKRWVSVDKMNSAYGSTFSTFDAVPMPKSETDGAFSLAEVAYSDFIRSMGEWYFSLYDECRRLWHREGAPANVPYLLQFSGYDAEKFMLGRPGLWSFAWMNWMEKADGIGLSLYTDGRYPDWGHASIRAMVNVIHTLLRGKKPVFVLESGVENPDPVFNFEELTFIADQARRLAPVTFVYEFLKCPYYREMLPNDARLLDPDARLRPGVQSGLETIFKIVKSSAAEETEPRVWIRFDSDATRDSIRAGQIYSALTKASADLAIGWTLKRHVPNKAPVWRFSPDGFQHQTKLSQLIDKASRPQDYAYIAWHENLMKMLSTDSDTIFK